MAPLRMRSRLAAGVAALALVVAPAAGVSLAQGTQEDSGSAPGAPQWPDGPPPGSAFEPDQHLAPATPDAAEPDSLEPSLRNQVNTGRLAGTDRYATAAAISRRAFPDGAGTVYLARGDVLHDAQAAGALTDGPVLLVRSCSVPSAAAAEIERLDPTAVVALGGSGSVCDAALQEAAQGRPTDRVGGANRYETAALIAQRAFPSGSTSVYLARGEGAWSPDALTGGVLKDGPVLLTRRDGVPSAAAQALEALDPDAVLALGGEAAVPDALLQAAAVGRETGRLSGPDRQATAAAIARHAFGRTERTAYLARPDDPADSVAAGVLTDGPILLASNDCGVLKEATWRHLGNARPSRVIALGGTGGVCGEALTTAARMSTFTPYEAGRDGYLLALITKSRAVNPLRHVPSDLVAFRGGSHQLRSEVAAQLDGLFRAAADAGHPQLHLTSGFRSYQTQQATYDYWVRVLGQKEADRVSARAGHSEHQLGQAADIWGRDCSGRDCFGATPEGRWVTANAHRWGFIIRYPRAGEPITGYVWEPWHLRYVGPRAAWMMTVRDVDYWEHYRSRAVEDSRGF